MSATVSKAGRPFSLLSLSVSHLETEFFFFFSILGSDFFSSESDKEQIYIVWTASSLPGVTKAAAGGLQGEGCMLVSTC